MKKIGIVLGAAAIATLAGCKDPSYNSKWNKKPQEVKNVPVEEGQTAVKPVEPAAKPADKVNETPVVVETIEPKGCTCPAGTKHTEPCACGAADCRCEVVAPAPVKPAEPESVVYIVQRNDTLSKISKKFNVKMSAIYKLNPSLKGDAIRIGQKLNLPAGIDVGEQKAPEVAKPAKKAYAPYTGATREYVVKSGDTLGAIAYGNGINIRQLKELNGLSSDMLRIGQKLLVPADGKAVAAAAKPAPAKKAEPAVAAKKVEPAPAASVEPEVVAEPADAEPAPVVEADAADAVAPVAAEPATTSYVVQEGDDMTSVSISWGVSAAQIRELNNLGDNDQLKPGQVIKLPADAQQ